MGVRRRFRARLVGLAVLTCALGARLADGGQAVSGALLGNVTDPAGLPLAGASVALVETNTNVALATTTNPSGFYAATVKDGIYRVQVEHPGFKMAVQTGIVVAVNTTVRVDVALSIGDVAESVTVQAATPLQADRADTGRILPGALIQQLPLAFNRNFQGALALVPGATLPYRPHSEFFNAQDSLSSNVNGQSRLANSVQIDGVDDNQRTGLLTVLIPSIEAIESVSVSTSNYDAELGRAGGAVTSVTLKSGGNTLAGTAFAFGNTEATMAAGYFSHVKPQTSYFQGGVAAGGPLRRDKAFFFADYQHTIDHRGGTTRAAIPPLAFRNGDFSAAPTVIYDPRTGNADGTGRRPFPGNVVPADRISPVARAILAQLPAPNLEAAPGQPNYQASYRRDKDTPSFDVKFTQQISPADQASARLSFQRPSLVDPPIFGALGGGGKDFAGAGTNLTYSSGLSYSRVWSPSLLMELRGGVSYYHNRATTAGDGLTTAADVGIPGANLDAWTSGMTSIEIAGFTNPLVGFDPSLPWDRSERTVQLSTVVNKTRGNHLIKFGGDVRRNRDLLLQTQDSGGSRGRFRFAGAQTALPTDTAAQGGFANAFAAFLLDAPASFGRDLRILDSGTRHTQLFTFIQDKWRASSRLTIDVGLRHEYYTPLVGLADRAGLSNYDPDTNTLRVAGFGEVDARVGVRRYFGNLGPRTGAAYRLDDRSVIRAGYGVATVPFPDNAYAFNFPVRQSNDVVAPNTFAAAGSMAAGFPPPATAAIPDSGIIDASTPALRTLAVTHVPRDLHEGSVHAWNVAYERQVLGQWTVEAAYVANRGRDILATMNLNAGMVLGGDNAGRPLFPRFGRTAEVATWVPVKSTYHSLQVKADRRLAGGVAVTTSYTLGRGMNYSTGDSNGNIQTPIDPERSWGRRNDDRLHNFVASWVARLPAPGRSSAGIVPALVGNWQVSGILVAQSGTPIDFTAANAILRAPGNRQRPNASGPPAVLGGIGASQLWFDTSVFSAPAPATFGNVARSGLLDGPAYFNLDASLVKTVGAGPVRGQLRVDAFNLLNTPHFNNPDGMLGNATFGRITSVAPGSERLVRFGLRVLF